jgi:basic membrane protein A and related proteins
MVSDTGGIDDRSFNASAWAGLQQAQATLPVTASFLESKAASDYTPNINAEVKSGCKLIVTVGFTLADATYAAAQANPKVDFALIDSTTTKPLANVRPLLFNTAEPSYAAGYLAAGMSKSGKVGTFGGINIPPVTDYMTGFYQGVQGYNTAHKTKVTVLGWNAADPKSSSFAGSFTDTAKGQALASGFLQQGADIVFPVAGGTGLGAAAAVKAANNANDSVIWVDSDGFVSAPQYGGLFLTTVLKGINVAVLDTVTLLVNNQWTNANYIGTVANKGVGLAPYHDWATKVPQTLQTEVNQVLADIASGKIVVKSS